MEHGFVKPEAEMNSWRELLKHYIQHVGSCEGVSFIGGHQNWGDLTKKEMHTLELLEQEISEERESQHRG